MKAVNAQTQFLLEKMRTKQRAAEAAGEPLPTPFDALDKGRKALGREWDDNTKRMAIRALTVWVATLVGSMLTVTMNEIATVGRLAADSNDESSKKAAFELATSMDFIESVMKMFAEAIDFEYIAEQLFEDGQKAAEASPQATAKFVEKYKPSVN